MFYFKVKGYTTKGINSFSLGPTPKGKNLLLDGANSFLLAPFSENFQTVCKQLSVYKKLFPFAYRLQNVSEVSIHFKTQYLVGHRI